MEAGCQQQLGVPACSGYLTGLCPHQVPSPELATQSEDRRARPALSSRLPDWRGRTHRISLMAAGVVPV